MNLQEAEKWIATHFYIMKEGYYYRPDSRGYTPNEEEAGIYLRDDALDHARHCEHIRLQPIDITDHNARIQNKVNDMLTRIIKV